MSHVLSFSAVIFALARASGLRIFAGDLLFLVCHFFHHSLCAWYSFALFCEVPFLFFFFAATFENCNLLPTKHSQIHPRRPFYLDFSCTREVNVLSLQRYLFPKMSGSFFSPAEKSGSVKLPAFDERVGVINITPPYVSSPQPPSLCPLSDPD